MWKIMWKVSKNYFRIEVTYATRHLNPPLIISSVKKNKNEGRRRDFLVIVVQLENSFVSPGSNKLRPPCPCPRYPELVLMCCVQSRDYLVKVKGIFNEFQTIKSLNIYDFLTTTQPSPSRGSDVMTELKVGSNQVRQRRQGKETAVSLVSVWGRSGRLVWTAWIGHFTGLGGPALACDNIFGSFWQICPLPTSRIPVTAVFA